MTFKEYWNTWLWSSMPRRLMTVNFLVWLAISLGLAFVPEGYNGWWLGLFGVPASIFELPMRIWTVGTYMFSHYDFIHMLVNMMWLWLFGTLIEMCLDSKRLLAVYVVSGLAAAGAFVVTNIFMPSTAPMLGASCSVIGVVGATMAVAPNVRANLLFFGQVRVLWIALAAIVLFVIIEPNMYMSIAHGAGLAAGYLYGMLAKGEAVRSLFNRRRVQPQAAPGFRSNSLNPRQAEERLDNLLQKVSRSGYDSLNAAERQELFELSQRLKS